MKILKAQERSKIECRRWATGTILQFTWMVRGRVSGCINVFQNMLILRYHINFHHRIVA